MEKDKIVRWGCMTIVILAIIITAFFMVLYFIK